MKVLIAEDNTISCRALAGNLESWGYDVVVTRNGQEAWEAFNGHPSQGSLDNSIQVALLDWEMPKISGLDLCRRIRSHSGETGRSYVYLILMTGRDNQEDILQGLSAGADDYMIKPFDHIELKIRVQNGIRIAALEEARHTLESEHESTILWNRNQILEFLDDEIQRNRRQNLPTGVVLLGIHGLDRAELGPESPTRERLLSEVTLRLRHSMRCYDKLGRFDEDEFLGVFPNCRLEHLHIIAERLRRAAVEVSPLRREKPRSYPWGGTSSDYIMDCSSSDLLSAAHHALRASRKRGESCVVINPLERKQ